jgi:hypothetical protein
MIFITNFNKILMTDTENHVTQYDLLQFMIFSWSYAVWQACISHVVTGVCFRMIGSHINFEIRITEMDFVKGFLNDQISIWVSNDNTDVSPKRRTDRMCPPAAVTEQSVRSVPHSDVGLNHTRTLTYRMWCRCRLYPSLGPASTIRGSKIQGDLWRPKFSCQEPQ